LNPLAERICFSQARALAGGALAVMIAEAKAASEGAAEVIHSIRVEELQQRRRLQGSRATRDADAASSAEVAALVSAGCRDVALRIEHIADSSRGVCQPKHPTLL
jgi:hypothetical protein